MSSKDERTLDRRGRLRSPAAMPGYHTGRTPVTKGQKFPPDPVAVEDIVAIFAVCKPKRGGRAAELSAMRLRALIVILWRTGMRISEALALEERDLNRKEMAITIRSGKGGKRRLVLMDEWGWRELEVWLAARVEITFGAIFCVLSGPTAGYSMSDSDARRQLRDATKQAGLRRRVHPHAFRHTCAVELLREEITEYGIQRQFGHQRLTTTELYLRSIATTELLEPIGRRHAPMMPVPVTHTK